MRIGVLSKDRGEAGLICEVLQAQGHVCILAGDGRPLSSQAQASEIDLLVMDWQPGGESAAVLARLRMGNSAGNIRLPLLVVVGRSDDDIVAALDAGADDCIVRPLRRGELGIRVRALLRRSYPQSRSAQEQVFGAYRFDTSAATLNVDGRAIELTQKEFDLALLFFRHLDRPLSRAYIQEAIWPGQEDAGRSVDTHVSRVRTKLGLRPENGFRLSPVYSYGYRLQKLAE